MIARFVRAALFMATLCAVAAPPLTTIQDVLYKADGSRFNGVVTVSWKSFEAPDTSNITNQTLSVKVVDGSLRLQLVPTTSSSAAVYYSVKYNSDGKVQFEETWAVPASVRPLRVRDVRVAAAPVLQAGNDASTGLPVQESDVTGLTADLSARPLKSPGYAAGRLVFVNLQGSLESVAGSAADCVRVDGSSGPCGGLEPAFVDNETPQGLVDSNNLTFTLAAAPYPAASLSLYRNGVLLKANLDYVLSDRTVTFIPEMAPQPGDTLLAGYRLQGADTVTPQPYPLPQVLCSGVGGGTNAASPARLGMCSIPAGVLAPGDRVEVKVDLRHQGSAGGFHFAVGWGATSMLARDAGAADTIVKGRAEAALNNPESLLSSQSWGTVLPLAASVGSSTAAFDQGVVVEFTGQVTAAGADTLTLTGFTVVRYP